MSTFAQERSTARTPSRHVVASPDVFQTLWSERPIGEVAIGIRLLSDAEIQSVRAEAARYAVKMYQLGDADCIDEVSRIECFNDALILGGLAYALTDANDVTVAYFGDFAADTIRNAVTSEGARFLWHAVTKAHKVAGSTPEASEEELAELAARIAAGGMAKVLGALPHDLRKLAFYILTELRSAHPDFDGAGTDDEEAGEYSIRIAAS